MFSKSLGLLSVFLLSISASGADTLLSELTKAREYLKSNGIHIEAQYTGDIVSNVSGGLEQKTGTLDNTDLQFTFDFDTLFNTHNLKGFVYILSNNGSNPSEFIGDIQVTSNIEAPKATKIYEAWLEKTFNNNSLSILFGLYDLNSEFDIIETAGLFINSSHGIGPDLSQTGENGPSIFPNTSLALRIRRSFSNGMYIQGAMLDGVPQDPNNPKGTHISLDSDDGTLSIIELGKDKTLPGDLSWSFGAWQYSKPSDNIHNPGFPDKSRNRGCYLSVEKSIFSESIDTAQGCRVFARIGVADQKVNTVDLYFGAGIVYTGLIPGRDEDTVGIAVGNAQSGGFYRIAASRLSQQVTSHETNIELTYNCKINSWLSIQPDIQYIINPGMTPHLNNALVLSLRTRIAF